MLLPERPPDYREEEIVLTQSLIRRWLARKELKARRRARNRDIRVATLEDRQFDGRYGDRRKLLKQNRAEVERAKLEEYEWKQATAAAVRIQCWWRGILARREFDLRWRMKLDGRLDKERVWNRLQKNRRTEVYLRVISDKERLGAWEARERVLWQLMSELNLTESRVRETLYKMAEKNWDVITTEKRMEQVDIVWGDRERDMLRDALDGGRFISASEAKDRKDIELAFEFQTPWVAQAAATRALGDIQEVVDVEGRKRLVTLQQETSEWVMIRKWYVTRIAGCVEKEEIRRREELLEEEARARKRLNTIRAHDRSRALDAKIRSQRFYSSWEDVLVKESEERGALESTEILLRMQLQEAQKLSKQSAILKRGIKTIVQEEARDRKRIFATEEEEFEGFAELVVLSVQELRWRVHVDAVSKIEYLEELHRKKIDQEAKSERRQTLRAVWEDKQKYERWVIEDYTMRILNEIVEDEDIIWDDMMDIFITERLGPWMQTVESVEAKHRHKLQNEEEYTNRRMVQKFVKGLTDVVTYEAYRRRILGLFQKIGGRAWIISRRLIILGQQAKTRVALRKIAIKMEALFAREVELRHEMVREEERRRFDHWLQHVRAEEEVHRDDVEHIEEMALLGLWTDTEVGIFSLIENAEVFRERVLVSRGLFKERRALIREFKKSLHALKLKAFYPIVWDNWQKSEEFTMCMHDSPEHAGVAPFLMLMAQEKKERLIIAANQMVPWPKFKAEEIKYRVKLHQRSGWRRYSTTSMPFELEPKMKPPLRRADSQQDVHKLSRKCDLWADDDEQHRINNLLADLTYLNTASLKSENYHHSTMERLKNEEARRRQMPQPTTPMMRSVKAQAQPQRDRLKDIAADEAIMTKLYPGMTADDFSTPKRADPHEMTATVDPIHGTIRVNPPKSQTPVTRPWSASSANPNEWRHDRPVDIPEVTGTPSPLATWLVNREGLGRTIIQPSTQNVGPWHTKTVTREIQGASGLSIHMKNQAPPNPHPSIITNPAYCHRGHGLSPLNERDPNPTEGLISFPTAYNPSKGPQASRNTNQPHLINNAQIASHEVKQTLTEICSPINRYFPNPHTPRQHPFAPSPTTDQSKPAPTQSRPFQSTGYQGFVAPHRRAKAIGPLPLKDRAPSPSTGSLMPTMRARRAGGSPPTIRKVEAHYQAAANRDLWEAVDRKFPPQATNYKPLLGDDTLKAKAIPSSAVHNTAAQCDHHKSERKGVKVCCMTCLRATFAARAEV